jgi:predicted nucleic acid-binding protein
MASPFRLFCDTSFYYACLDPAEANHRRASALLAEASATDSAFCTTWDVIGETVTLLRDRRSFRTALAFLDEVKPSLQLIPYGDRVRLEAEHLFREYGRDHRLSFCDAISFVVVTTLLDHAACLTFDRDFRSLGLTVLP